MDHFFTEVAFLFDENKYNSIVFKHRKEIFTYCVDRISRDEFSADEITNDVFVALFRKWDTLEFTEIRAWLFRTADNYMRHHYRTQKKKNAIEEISERNLPAELTSNDCEEQIISENYVSSIADKLDDDEKILFRYRYIDQMTLTEISKLTGIPYSTLRGKLNQIKKKIQDYMKYSEK